jgi:hypothetical protein
MFLAFYIKTELLNTVARFSFILKREWVVTLHESQHTFLRATRMQHAKFNEQKNITTKHLETYILCSRHTFSVITITHFKNRVTLFVPLCARLRNSYMSLSSHYLFAVRHSLTCAAYCSSQAERPTVLLYICILSHIVNTLSLSFSVFVRLVNV